MPVSNYFIENPERNPFENLFRFTTDNKFLLFPRFLAELTTHGIAADSYPQAVDLASGDGGVASFLVELGWESKNITCIDRLQAPYFAVSDTAWLYIDLELLVLELKARESRHRELDPRLSVLKGKYDLLTCNFAHFPDESIAILAQFFLRQDGIAVIDGIAKRRERF